MFDVLVKRLWKVGKPEIVRIKFETQKGGSSELLFLRSICAVGLSPISDGNSQKRQLFQVHVSLHIYIVASCAVYLYCDAVA